MRTSTHNPLEFDKKKHPIEIPQESVLDLILIFYAKKLIIGPTITKEIQ